MGNFLPTPWPAVYGGGQETVLTRALTHLERLEAEAIHIFREVVAEAERPVMVRIRSTRPPRPAILRPTGPHEAEIELLQPEEGVSPGQACVFYAEGGTQVLGGGWIMLRRPARG